MSPYLKVQFKHFLLNKKVQNGNFSKQILQHLKRSLFGQQLLGFSIIRFSYFEMFAAVKMLQKFKVTKNMQPLLTS